MTSIPYQRCLVASHLFCFRDDHILLARRSNTGYEDGNYGVPAGHVDEGESGIDAMVREAREEVGMVLAATDLTVVHVMHRDTEVGPWFNLFLSCEWQPTFGEPHNREPEKCDHVAWFPLTEVPSNMVPYVRTGLEHARAGTPYSELGWQPRRSSCAATAPPAGKGGQHEEAR